MRKKRRLNQSGKEKSLIPTSNIQSNAEPDKEAFRLFANELVNRMTLAYSASGQNIGVTHNGARDLYTILGYKKELNFNDYFWRYERQDIATRVVNAFPSACWSMKPIVTESNTPTNDTEFEKAFAEMVIKKKVYHYLARTDVLSGIGRFGIIVLGFADNKKLDTQATKKAGMKLSYIRPYHEGSASIETYDNDTSSERYGLPVMYKVNTAISEVSNALSPTTADTINTIRVHWSRVIHVLPELGTENDIYGTPRLKNIYNRLQDIEAIAGGGAEMFWRGAFQGLVFKNDEGATMDATNKAALTTEIEDYVNNMKRYIKAQNMDVSTLDTQVADPSNHFDIQVTLVAAAKGMPKRIILGSERGELASSQDSINWNKKVDERRVDQCELTILRPFIDRMIMFGVLPEPTEDYTVTWPDLYTQSGLEKSKVSESLMRALKDYLSMPEGQMILPPKVFLEKILGFSEDEVAQSEDIINKMSQKEIDDIMEDEDIDEGRDNNSK